MKNQITGIVLTLNEEKDIEYCLRSLNWCDEVIVVDSYSDDKTVEIAKEYGARVFKREVEGNSFDKLRNFAISKAENEWLFVLDADEVCPKNLSERLQRIRENDNYDCVKIPRKNYSYGHWLYYDIWPDYQRRFFRKELVEYQDELHSALKVAKEAKTLTLEPEENISIKHYTAVDIHSKIEKINRFTTIKSRNEREPKPFKAILKAPLDFFKALGKKAIYKRGYKRGYEVLIEAAYVPLATLLIEFKKWQIENHGSKEEIMEIYNCEREHLVNQYE